MEIKQRESKNGGFTLVELIIVIAILAVLGSIAVPNLIGYVEKSREAKDYANAKVIADAVTMYLAENDGVGAIARVEVKATASTPPVVEYIKNSCGGTLPTIVAAKYKGDHFHVEADADGNVKVTDSTTGTHKVVFPAP